MAKNVVIQSNCPPESRAWSQETEQKRAYCSGQNLLVDRLCLLILSVLSLVMGAFPQYSRNEFNFATESYGGHYGPIFNAYIESQNDLIEKSSLPGAHHIKLSTLLIGNGIHPSDPKAPFLCLRLTSFKGWYDPLVQYAAFYNFTVSPGNTYDYDPYNQSTKDQLYNAMYGPGNCYDRTLDCYNRGINEVS